MSTWCLLTVLSIFSVTYADDTEIFFSQVEGSAETHPNIVFVLDDSGSMRWGGKLDNMITAMNAIIANNNDINIGIMSFDEYTWNGQEWGGTDLGNLLYPVTSINSDDVRDDMQAAVNGLDAFGWTPLVGAHYEAAMVMTGGPIKRNSATSYPSPMIGACQNNHIVLLSDGTAFGHPGQQLIQDSTGDTSCAFNRPEEACGVELAQWLNETDHKPGLDGMQNISTYTIGFNIQSPYLQDVAAAGGGKYFEANDAAELEAVFQEIVETVADVDTTFAAPAVTVSQQNRLSLGRDLYFSVFKPAQRPTWDGNLKRYRLGFVNDEFQILDKNANDAVDPTTGFFSQSATSYWTEGVVDGSSVALGGASSKIGAKTLEGNDRRRVFTYIGPVKTNGNANSSIDLRLTSSKEYELHEDNAKIKNRHVGAGGAFAGVDRTAWLRWMRGYDVKDENEDGNTTDVRPHMGDPLHSTAAVVHYSGNKSTAFVGTNEGLLHAIDTDDGTEIYSFMPGLLLENIQTFFFDDQSDERPYGLDGDITLWHDDDDGNGYVNGGEKAYLYVGMRRGGRQYFAFDVSNRDELTYLWRIKGGNGEFQSLGQTWSKPIKTKLTFKGDIRDVLIFGGGYDTNQDSENGSHKRSDSYGNSIFIVDALTGRQIWRAKPNRFPLMDYSIPSNIRVMDIDANGLADRMYVGDMGGQVWRLDIKQHHQQGDGQLVEGGVIADLGAQDGSSSRRFFEEPDVALINQQGQQFMSVSLGSGWRAHPLDRSTDDKFFMIRDNYPLSNPGGYGYLQGSNWQAIGLENLVDVSSTLGQSLYDLPNGWYIDLEGTGEKSLSKSLTVNNQLLFTTYLPGVVSNACQPSLGTGFSYAVNVANGDPAIEFSNSPAGGGGVLDKNDRKDELLAVGIPPSPVAIIAEIDGQIETGIFVGQQSIGSVDFGLLTYRTYWLDRRRGPQTPAQITPVNAP